MLTQLREVRPAGESAKVAMKNHQEPPATVIIELVEMAIAVVEAEGDRRLVRQVFHGCLLGFGVDR